MGQVCDVDRQKIVEDQERQNQVSLKVSKPPIIEAVALQPDMPISQPLPDADPVKEKQSFEKRAVLLKEQLQLPEAVAKRLEELGPFNLSGLYVTAPKANMQQIYLLNNGIRYAGEWQGDQPHGKGVYLLQDNSYLQASVAQDEVAGIGRFINSNGDYYEGEFKGTKAHGHGRYQQGNVLYEGEFVDNLPHGEGIESGDNFRFVGRFERGARKQGKLIWKDELGSYTYEGTFKNNLFSGLGVLKDERKTITGIFKEGRMIEEENLQALPATI